MQSMIKMILYLLSKRPILSFIFCFLFIYFDDIFASDRNPQKIIFCDFFKSMYDHHLTMLNDTFLLIATFISTLIFLNPRHAERGELSCVEPYQLQQWWLRVHQNNGTMIATRLTRSSPSSIAASISIRLCMITTSVRPTKPATICHLTAVFCSMTNHYNLIIWHDIFKGKKNHNYADTI